MIGIIGVNHQTAPVEIRERFVFGEEEIVQFIDSMRKAQVCDEAVILSTCNRTEIIFHAQQESTDAAFDGLISEVSAFKGIEGDLADHFYTYTEQEAVDHLLRVAAGLNSLVLGENEILGQVKDAFRVSSERKLTATVLSKLFDKALEAGKRVRTETSINEGASSVGYAAVEVASKIFEKLSQHTVLLVGAGETGELVLRSLAERGCKSVLVTNRTRSRAESVAEKHGATVVDFEERNAHLCECDIIITSVAAPEPLIHAQEVKQSMHSRKGRPIFLIDLSVPRAVSEDVRAIEDVFLYDIDDLEQVVGHNYEKRKKEIEKAVKIVERIAHDFSTWLSSLNLTPTITLLKDKIDNLAADELRSLNNKLTEIEYGKVVAFAGFLKRKYLSMIIKNLKSLSENGKKLDYIELVNDLFELNRGDDNAPHQDTNGNARQHPSARPSEVREASPGGNAR